MHNLIPLAVAGLVAAAVITIGFFISFLRNRYWEALDGSRRPPMRTRLPGYA